MKSKEQASKDKYGHNENYSHSCAPYHPASGDMSFGMGQSAWDTELNPNGGHRTYARLISSWQLSRFGAVPGSAFVFSFLLSFPSSISLSKTHRPDRHRRTARIRARNASHPGSSPQAARPCKAARGRFLSRSVSRPRKGSRLADHPKHQQLSFHGAAGGVRAAGTQAELARTSGGCQGGEVNQHLPSRSPPADRSSRPAQVPGE